MKNEGEEKKKSEEEQGCVLGKETRIMESVRHVLKEEVKLRSRGCSL